MLYNIGDVVYIRDDINMETVYLAEDNLHKEIVVSGMLKFKGKKAIISGIDEYFKKYLIEGCHWGWVSSMFEDIDPNYNLFVDLSEFV